MVLDETSGPKVPGSNTQVLIKVSQKGTYGQLATKIVSEYDQEIPQSQTSDYSVAPRGRAAQPSRDTRKTN